MSAYRFAPQFFACEQTNRIDGRRITSNALGNSTGASRFALVALVGATLRLFTRNEGYRISTAVVLHQSHRCEEIAPLFERMRRQNESP